MSWIYKINPTQGHTVHSEWTKAIHLPTKYQF